MRKCFSLILIYVFQKIIIFQKHFCWLQNGKWCNILEWKLWEKDLLVSRKSLGPDVWLTKCILLKYKHLPLNALPSLFNVFIYYYTSSSFYKLLYHLYRKKICWCLISRLRLLSLTWCMYVITCSKHHHIHPFG